MEEKRRERRKESWALLFFFRLSPWESFRVPGRFSEEDVEHHFQRTQLPGFPLPSGIRFVQFHPQLLQKPLFFLHSIPLGFWFASLKRIGLFVLVCFSPLFNAKWRFVGCWWKKARFFRFWSWQKCVLISHFWNCCFSPCLLTWTREMGFLWSG